MPMVHHAQVLIKIIATALNRADTLQRKGAYPPPPGETDILGLECVGEVVTGGTEFHEGDRVMSLLASGGYAEYVAVDCFLGQVHCTRTSMLQVHVLLYVGD